MTNETFAILIGRGIHPASILSEAQTLARQTGHPVGIRKLASGSTELIVLKTAELLGDTFGRIVQPGDDGD